MRIRRQEKNYASTPKWRRRHGLILRSTALLESGLMPMSV
jgi:hypothetical protein